MGPEQGEELPLVGNREAGQPALLELGQEGVLVAGAAVGEGPPGPLAGGPVDPGQAQPVGGGLIAVGAARARSR